MLAVVNPNHTQHSLNEIERCVKAGAIGIKDAARVRRSELRRLEKRENLWAAGGVSEADQRQRGVAANHL